MANGTFGGGNGTIGNPFLIEDAHDLYAIRSNLSRHFKLARNINLDVPPFDKSGWTPLPGAFRGSLNGNGKKIFNLVIDARGQDNVGLFSYIDCNFYNVGSAHWTRVYDLSIENAAVTGRNYVGILAGQMLCRPQDAVFTGAECLALSGIHVSGTVSCYGSCVGGMIGWLNCYTNNYAWRFAENCLVDVRLDFQAQDALAGLMFGYLHSTWTGYAPLQMIDCVVRGTIECRAGTPKNAQSIVCPGVNSSGLTVTSCVYDATLWPGKATPGSLGKTAEKMLRKDEFGNLELKKSTDGKPVWIFGYQKHPRLRFMELNRLFVMANGNCYTYDAAKKQWVKRFDRMPTLAEAERDGMESLDEIDQEGWAAMKAIAPSAAVVDIVDKSVGISLQDYTVALERDASKELPGKQTYRKTIVLADYDHGIYAMEAQ